MMEALKNKVLREVLKDNELREKMTEVEKLQNDFKLAPTTKEEEIEKPKKKKTIKVKEKKDYRSIETLFRNALRSNLDLTSLADAKASVLISVNGFILTVIITASGLYLNNPDMLYPFITIMLTALISILLGTMAIRPRDKVNLIKKEHLENFSSVAYFQDMSEVSPDEYFQTVSTILKDKESVHEHIIKHIHILGSEIKVKYRWLKRAYTAFGLGLSLSAMFMIVAMLKDVAIISHPNQFSKIYEPSGAAALEEGRVLLVEDESSQSLQLIQVNSNGSVDELGQPKMSQKATRIFKNKVRDLEGATSNGEESIYLITSHTTNKSHKHKAPREQIVRLEYLNGKVDHVRLYHGLLDAMKKLHPQFAEALSTEKKVSRKKEINIEALVWNREEKSLLIGLRSPLIEGKAVVVPLQNPDAIFDNEEEAKLKKPILLDLEGDGIRGMSWDEKKQGYWIIAGDIGKRKEGFTLWFWDKQHNRLTINEEVTNLGFAEGIINVKNRGMLIVKDDGSAETHGANYTLIKEEN